MRTQGNFPITHPKIAPKQARLTVEFLAYGSLEKKMCLVDMGSLSILFKAQSGVSQEPLLVVCQWHSSLIPPFPIQVCLRRQPAALSVSDFHRAFQPRFPRTEENSWGHAQLILKTK